MWNNTYELITPVLDHWKEHQINMIKLTIGFSTHDYITPLEPSIHKQGLSSRDMNHLNYEILLVCDSPCGCNRMLTIGPLHDTPTNNCFSYS